MFHQRAVTLLEVIITFTIISMLSVISFSSWQHFSQQAEEKLILTQLLHAIFFAQAEAEARGLPVVVARDGAWEKGQIVFADINNNGMVTDKKQILAMLHSQSHHGVVHWRAFPFYRDYLLFSGNGLMQSDNGTFWYCHADNLPVWAIILNKAGKSRAVYPDAENKILDSQGKPLSCG